MQTNAGMKNALKWITILVAAITAFIAAGSVVAEHRDRTEQSSAADSVQTTDK